VRPVVTAAEMRALERATIEELGVPAFTLMETAGRACAAVARRMIGVGARVAVVCGPGNNGGDGFVIARVLREAGIEATAYLAAARASVRGDAAAQLALLEKVGGVVRSIAAPRELDDRAAAIAGAELVVDALFGIGLSRAIDGHLAAVVATMNRAPRRLAVDVPSGLDTDTGAILGAVVRADATVTMAAAKLALVSAPGFAHTGQLEIAEIGIPRALIAASHPRAMLVEAADVAGWLPRSAPLDHKGTRGHAVVVGGSPGMRGAGRLAAAAALRAGAGLCTLAAAEGPDLTADDSVMIRALRASGKLGDFVDGKAAIGIGPGLGKDKHARGWIDEVLAAGIPAVLDADALNAFAGHADELAAARGPIVITPHPGEAGRLLGKDAAAIEADRLAAARELAAITRAIVVLKGARTLVCDGRAGDDVCYINPTGGTALATGGSGDVLTGTITGLLAQRLAPLDAARAGVYVHGAAGEQLGCEHGPRGALSSDLPRAIAVAIAAHAT
jgi:NAD(P)H-hydrate epimerase